MKTLGYIMAGILSLVLIIVLAFALNLGGLQWNKFFKPRSAAIERQVFQETASYVRGKTQELSKLYVEYQKASSSADKEAIESIVRMSFAEVNPDVITSPQLKQFLKNAMHY